MEIENTFCVTPQLSGGQIRTNWETTAIAVIAPLCLLLFCASGCQQQTVGKLLGQWEGRPDTATARAEREQGKYGGKQPDGTPDRILEDAALITDWEQFDVMVRFDFQSADRVEMSLNGNEEVRAASWQIVANTPTGCTIEVRTNSPEEPIDGADAPRRFELEFDECEGECVGFLLSEVGADRQLGALYFRRVASEQ